MQKQQFHYATIKQWNHLKFNTQEIKPTRWELTNSHHVTSAIIWWELAIGFIARLFQLITFTWATVHYERYKWCLMVWRRLLSHQRLHTEHHHTSVLTTHTNVLTTAASDYTQQCHHTAMSSHKCPHICHLIESSHMLCFKSTSSSMSSHSKSSHTLQALLQDDRTSHRLTDGQTQLQPAYHNLHSNVQQKVTKTYDIILL